MRVNVTDTAVKPPYRGELDPIDGSARDVAWPGPRAGDVKVTAKGLQGATFELSGKVAPEGSRLTADLAGLPLAPFHSYAAPTGYGLGGGVAAVRSNIKLGPGSYDTSSEVVLNRLQVTGSEGDALFAQQFGMPLSMALALMTDLQGNIKLTLPVAGDRSGTRIGIAKIIRDTLARAVLNAATSPLKLIGAVANIGDKPASLAPQPVIFADGRAEFAKDEAEKLEQVARQLASTPSVGLRLRGEAGDADRRWLAEQKLRAQLEEEGGFLGSVRHIGERAVRKTALDVLAKRAEDEKAEMPEEHREWLEQAVAKHEVTDEELAALARARTAAVRAKLVEDAKDVAPERIVSDDPAPEDLGARSVVAITLTTGVQAPIGSSANAAADTR
jgi:hypothetical protein